MAKYRRIPPKISKEERQQERQEHLALFNIICKHWTRCELFYVSSLYTTFTDNHAPTCDGRYFALYVHTDKNNVTHHVVVDYRRKTFSVWGEFARGYGDSRPTFSQQNKHLVPPRYRERDLLSLTQHEWWEVNSWRKQHGLS